MTRINVGIHPSELTKAHLNAEHREIKRIPNTIKSGRAIVRDIPETFRLGPGHVKFFYTRLGYLLDRYKSIHAECLARGMNVQDFSSAWDGIPDELMGNYTPTEEDRKIVMQRIKERLAKSEGV